ncbi:NUDIX hydrolase [Roseovarius aestuarii]|uniref:NUDIX domain protein n=1 Tax=Roseovarius aestuarii TaxID=475083 RepID=A0A1X7BSP1_9RHOB|nr:NUDIX hydrolase [Roseovarius aestuarii]SMC12706.1 NUDIX domain protein [Roseovarius aestuarii]
MTNAMKKAWTGLVQPLLQRPRQFQVAALCYREVEGRTEVLLITSRDTGRWILPKGWPMDGMDAPDAALKEAWEEAGVKTGDLDKDPIGAFDYEKRLDDGYESPVHAQVYKVKVVEMTDEFPEADERSLSWFTPDEAANKVKEPGLQEILRQI